ncbi:hypothetical protein BpHYR1_021550 [Brachionus plicatilis]|uniref:Uncharacterized protein n=1 Tax=Brachionus plicatilis TaxID=10195 RepID=A0A3M7SY69_BRAPC|nr:hypothetical protein BpHYR1_021550 [Brachionus plicatilis]
MKFYKTTTKTYFVFLNYFLVRVFNFSKFAQFLQTSAFFMEFNNGDLVLKATKTFKTNIVKNFETLENYELKMQMPKFFFGHVDFDQVFTIKCELSSHVQNVISDQ